MKKLYIANVVFNKKGYGERKCTVAFAGMNDLENIVKALCEKMANEEERYELSSVEIEASNLLKQENEKQGE